MANSELPDNKDPAERMGEAVGRIVRLPLLGAVAAYFIVKKFSG